jgi:hypothetical protein
MDVYYQLVGYLGNNKFGRENVRTIAQRRLSPYVWELDAKGDAEVKLARVYFAREYGRLVIVRIDAQIEGE